MRSSFGPNQSTGLYDEALFLELLEREVARARRYARPLSLIMGRPAEQGAELSDFLSGGWMTLARDVDFGARLGDGCLVMALPETGRSGGAVAAERFRRGLELLVPASGQDGTHLSLGVVTHPYHGATAAALLKAADALSRHGSESSVAVAEFPRPPQEDKL